MSSNSLGPISFPNTPSVYSNQGARSSKDLRLTHKKPKTFPQRNIERPRIEHWGRHFSEEYSTDTSDYPTYFKKEGKKKKTETPLYLTVLRNNSVPQATKEYLQDIDKKIKAAEKLMCTLSLQSNPDNVKEKIRDVEVQIKNFDSNDLESVAIFSKEKPLFLSKIKEIEKKRERIQKLSSTSSSPYKEILHDKECWGESIDFTREVLNTHFNEDAEPTAKKPRQS